MKIFEGLIYEFICATKSYESTVESLKVKPVLVGLVLSPIFYLLFFFMVRLQSIGEGQEGSLLLLTLLLQPVSLCVYYIGTSFTNMKQWGVMSPLTLVQYSLFRLALQMSIFSTIVSSIITFFWFCILELIFVNFNLTTSQFFIFLIILLSCSFCLSLFGMLVSILILPIKKIHIITNVLYFLIIIFSGLMHISDSKDWFYFLSYLFPLKAFIMALSSLEVGEFNIRYLLLGYIDSFFYFLLSKALINLMQSKMQNNNSYLN